MTAAARSPAITGPLGPVAFFAGAALLALSPLARGGNRYFALIPLELIALVALGALLVGMASRRPALVFESPWLAVLALAPLVMAAVQLLPVIPGAVWLRLPGHEAFRGAIELAGGLDDWRPLSVLPRATAASALAGLPISAALLVGYFGSVPQLRALVGVAVGGALLQIAVSLLQLGAADGFLMFGAATGAPVGTFGNRNHLADYVAVALCCWIWLAWGTWRGPTWRSGSWALQSAVTVMLVIGLLVTRSRAAVVLGLALALAAVAMAGLVRGERTGHWRFAPAAVVGLPFALAILLGVDALTGRFLQESLGDALGYRALLASTSFDAALAFLPFGSGWDTYDAVYPRFQPVAIFKFANHAHMDYIEMLVEGGVLFVAFALLFVALAAGRARTLWRAVAGGDPAPDAVASAFCGIALAVPLLHALVDFPLRIPAIAILAGLLAGAFLRPLHATGPAHAPPQR